MHATKETKEAVYKSHVKVSSDMYATKETESHDDLVILTPMRREIEVIVLVLGH
jgi:hypothetical protein